MNGYDCQETERAAVLHAKWCRRNGFMEDQPSATLSGFEGDTVTLANVNGTMARYRLTPSGRLRRLDDPAND